MKSRRMPCGVTLTLFAALAIPIQVAAQEQKDHHGYSVIDLGTLGGPQSVVSGMLTKLLNNRGIVAGCGDTSNTNPNYPTSSAYFPGSPPLPDPFIFHTFQWQEGNITDLGALPGTNNSCALWITESGIVAGLSENAVVDPVSGLAEVRATLWKDGEVVDLGTFGGTESLALAANSRGQVVGSAANTTPDSFSLFGFSTETRAFLWENGVLKDLSTLGGPDAYASGINEAGQVAGCSYTNSTPNPTTGSPTLAPFLWKRDKMTNLGSLGGTMVSLSLSTIAIR